MPRHSRTAPCNPSEARTRLRTAQAYLEVAAFVLAERGRDEYLNVAVGLAILSGIAASDAICGIRLGCMHRGDDTVGPKICSGQRRETGQSSRRPLAAC